LNSAEQASHLKAELYIGRACTLKQAIYWQRWHTANQKNHVTISTSLQVLQYLRPSTRVLTAKYWSTDKEVLAFACSEVSSRQSVATRDLCKILLLCAILKFIVIVAVRSLCQSQPIYELSPIGNTKKHSEFIENLMRLILLHPF